MSMIRPPLVALLLPPLITALLKGSYWLLVHRGAEAALENNVEAMREQVRPVDQQLRAMKEQERLIDMRETKTVIQQTLSLRRSHDRMPDRLQSLAQKYGVELQGFDLHREVLDSGSHGIHYNYDLYFQAPKSVHFYRLLERLERERDFTTVRQLHEGEWAPRSRAGHTLAVSLRQVRLFKEKAQ